MSIYRKLTITLYRLPEFRQLPVTAKLVFLALLTSPGTTMIPGLYEGDALTLASVLALEAAEVIAALRELATRNLVDVDADRALIAIAFTDAIKDQQPANESVAKGWANTLANVIDCATKDRHINRLSALWPTWAKFLPTPCGQGADTVPAPWGTPCDLQDQDQDQQKQQQQEKQQEEEIAAEAAPPVGAGVRSGAGGSQNGKKPRKAKTGLTSEPLPYSVAQLLEALATSGRFVAAEPTKGQAINAQKLIRKHPLDQVQLAAAWLAAGGDGWKGSLDVRNLGDLSTWCAHAAQWDASGRPAIARNGKANGARANAAPMAHATSTREEKL